ncbi:MAG: NADH-quinone oxidoreductase subunit C [Deltaproteobacteria bacterium]|nr:NADH-quinone oxidoreductase subunit C [Deltaproteobacteria bacterium]
MRPVWMKDLKARCLCRCDFQKKGVSWRLFISSDVLPEAVSLLDEAEYFLEDISCLDTADGFAVFYHFSLFTGPDRVALCVILPHNGPEIPSIGSLYGGALWHERETRDFFGIDFTGHPDMKPLLLPEEMEGHPLVKAEKERVPLRALLDQGEIVLRDSDFLFFEEPDSPAGAPEPHGETPAANGGVS